MPGNLCGMNDFIHCGIRFSKADIFFDCSGKQVCFLRNKSDFTSKSIDIQIFDFLTVNVNISRSAVIKSWN